MKYKLREYIIKKRNEAAIQSELFRIMSEDMTKDRDDRKDAREIYYRYLHQVTAFDSIITDIALGELNNLFGGVDNE